MRHLLVIGGDAAGMSAASQARRLRGPDELAITVLERGGATSYAACGIPYWVAGLVTERSRLVARRAEEFRTRQAIEVHLGTEAVAIDTAARSVRARDVATGIEVEHAYDELLVATGTVPVLPPVPGLDAAGVMPIRTLDDGQALLDARVGQRGEGVAHGGSGRVPRRHARGDAGR